MTELEGLQWMGVDVEDARRRARTLEARGGGGIDSCGRGLSVSELGGGRIAGGREKRKGSVAAEVQPPSIRKGRVTDEEQAGPRSRRRAPFFPHVTSRASPPFPSLSLWKPARFP